MDTKFNLITILGPTASGKTSFAANLAYMLNGEIISADSRQVYKNMNIGTGKDYEDYIVNQTNIPYHLIDIVEPGYRYNVYEFQNDFLKVFNDINKRKKQPILCGGTGLYIEAVIKGYKFQKENPDSAFASDTVDEINFNYPDINTVLIGIKFDRDITRSRITERLKYRLKNGMIKEVENLLKAGIHKETLISYGLEYKYLTYYLLKEISYDEMFSKLNTAIHQFAKRQMTWFRRMERQGMKIHWLDGNLSLEKKLQITTDFTDKKSVKSV